MSCYFMFRNILFRKMNGVVILLLKKFRQKNCWTQLQVSEMLSVSERFYRSIEAGDRRPSYEKLNKLEDIFQIPQRVLFAKNIEEIPSFYNHYLSTLDTDN